MYFKLFTFRSLVEEGPFLWMMYLKILLLVLLNFLIYSFCLLKFFTKFQIGIIKKVFLIILDLTMQNISDIFQSMHL